MPRPRSRRANSICPRRLSAGSCCSGEACWSFYGSSGCICVTLTNSRPGGRPGCPGRRPLRRAARRSGWPALPCPAGRARRRRGGGGSRCGGSGTAPAHGRFSPGSTRSGELGAHLLRAPSAVPAADGRASGRSRGDALPVGTTRMEATVRQPTAGAACADQRLDRRAIGSAISALRRRT